VLEDAGLEDVTVGVMSTPMRAASLDEWWDRVPKLAGPLAIALGGMEPDVRDAIATRATQAGRRAAAHEADGIVFAGSVLIGSGHKAQEGVGATSGSAATSRAPGPPVAHGGGSASVGRPPIASMKSPASTI
jgi:hypothetical protein